MSVMQQTYTGYTCETKEFFLLDSGAVFKNFIVGEDTVETATAAGKLIGATRGGSTFTATPTTRMREVDGLRGTPKGGIAIDDWTVTLLSNFIEIKPETLKAALGAADIDEGADGEYTIIRGRSAANDSDYYDNITWVGTLSGSAKPVIIQLYNAMSTSGISMSFADKSEATLPVTFAATYDACGGTTDPNFAPFAIFFPGMRITPAPAPVPPAEEEDEEGGN